MDIMELLAGILNPNPGQNRLVNPNASGPNYLTQTGLGPEELARFHQQSGLGGGSMPQGAPPAADAWAGMREAGPPPDQQQAASVGQPAPSGSGFLERLFGGARSGENQTIQWLTDQGVDPGTATMMAKHKPALQAYLLKRSQGKQPIEIAGRLVDPDTYEVLADFSEGGNRQTATIDGKLVDTNTGQVIGDYGQPEVQTRTMTPEEVSAAGLAPGVYQQDKEGKIAAVGSVRDQDAGFKNEMELRKEYDMLPEVKDYKVVRSNYERIRQGVQLGTGAGDAAIVFGYMKMLDPTSVVREGEQATTRNAAGVPEAVRGMYNQLVGGGQLSGEARQQILGASEKVYGESVANIEDVNKRYGGYAGAWKLDPSRIVAPTEQYDPLLLGATPPPAPGAPVQPRASAPARKAFDELATGKPPADGWREVAPGVMLRKVN